MNNSNTNIREAYEENAVVCFLLKWSSDDYNTYQYETGIEYLQHLLPADEECADMLSRSKIFWNWWRHQWASRDKRLILAAYYWRYNAEDLTLIYKENNNARTLAAAIFPNGIIMRESARAIILDLFTPKNRRRMIMIKPDALPAFEKVVKDAEHKLQNLTGLNLKLQVRVSGGNIKEKEINLIMLLTDTYNVTWEDMVSVKRTFPTVEARQIYCYFMREKYGNKLAWIARRLNRHHTAVIYAVNRINELIQIKDYAIITKIKEIDETL